MTTPTPGRPRAARERDRVDRARNVARSVMSSLPTGKDVRQGAGLAPRPKAVAEAARHLEKALYAAGDDWVEQTSRARHFQAALAALQRAQRESPLDPTVLDVADKIRKTAAWALKDQGGAVSGRRQEDRVDARLQAVVDGAQEVHDQVRVKQSKQAHLDRYASEGAKSKADGGFEKLLVSNTHYSPLGPAPVAATKAPDERAFRKEVTHWLTAKKAVKDAEKQKQELVRLFNVDSALYERVREEVGGAYWAKHGLHLGEAAAISTYTASDYTYMNPAMAGGAAEATWFNGVAKGRSRDLFGGDKDRSAAENAQAQADAVAAFEQKRAPADAALAALRKKVPGLKPRPAPSASERLERAQREDLETTRQEGAQHSAVAYRGLLKLPFWKGTLFRGDAMDVKRFDSMFTVIPTTTQDPDGQSTTTYAFRAKSRTHTWPHLVSMSRARSIGENFGGQDEHRVVWEVSVIDGRDVSRLSKISTEVEVMVLPGTTVAIDSVELYPGDFTVTKPGLLKTPPDPTTYYKIVVKGHQVSAPQRPKL